MNVPVSSRSWHALMREQIRVVTESSRPAETHTDEGYRLGSNWENTASRLQLSSHVVALRRCVYVLFFHHNLWRSPHVCT